MSSHATVPGILWAVLLVGGVITVSFSYFFGTRNTWPQVLMIAALAAMVSLSLFLIMALDHPFQGPIHVKPSAFEQVIEIFDHWAEPP